MWSLDSRAGHGRSGQREARPLGPPRRLDRSLSAPCHARDVALISCRRAPWAWSFLLYIYIYIERERGTESAEAMRFLPPPPPGDGAVSTPLNERREVVRGFSGVDPHGRGKRQPRIVRREIAVHGIVRRHQAWRAA